jgi:hypothetical protein
MKPRKFSLAVPPVFLALLFLACPGLVTAESPCVGESSQFAYLSLAVGSDGAESPDGFNIDLSRSVHWRGHSGLRLAVCDSEDEHYCFHGTALSFAVPKVAPALGDSWTSMGRTFKASRAYNIRLLGQPLELTVIYSDRDKGFLYSSQRGLVAVVPGFNSSSPTQYWSASAFGFPFRECGEGESSGKP